MQDNIKDKVVVILFGLIIYGFFFLNLVTPDKKSSVSERRKLEQFPKVSLKAIIKGDFFKKFDNYSMDQFYQREKFRKLKIKTDMVVLGNYNNMQIDKDILNTLGISLSLIRGESGGNYSEGVINFTGLIKTIHIW